MISVVYRVSGYFKNYRVVEIVHNVYDAIEFKDIVDANYPLKVTFEKGVYPMRTFIVNGWNTIMDHNMNPLSNIPDLGVRHVVMQGLAWMWCIIFSMSVGSILVFQISAIAHALVIAGVFITFGTFETAKRKPNYFGGLGRGNGGEHE